MTLQWTPSTTGTLSITHEAKALPVEVKLFSPHSSDRTYNDFPFWRPTRQVMSPNVGALARIMSAELDQDMKDYSIWQGCSQYPRYRYGGNVNTAFFDGHAKSFRRNGTTSSLNWLKNVYINGVTNGATPAY